MRCHSKHRARREARRDEAGEVYHMQQKAFVHAWDYAQCTYIAEKEGGSKAREKRRRTNEIGMIRPKLLVQFDRMRFVYRVPEPHPVGDDGVDVFRRCIPGRRNSGVAKGGPPTHVRPSAKASNSGKVGEHTPHLRESVRKPALTSISSAQLRLARAPIVYKNKISEKDEKDSWMLRTRGTPTKMVLLSAASRMKAALRTASAMLSREPWTLGSERVANRYKCPIDVGTFAVNNVQV